MEATQYGRKSSEKQEADMNRKYPVIDTSLVAGVGAMTHFIAEEEMNQYLADNEIDIQYIYQPDAGFCHRTPDWNPYLGNDYIAKIQKMYEGRVIGLATVNFWLQKNPVCNCGAGDTCPHGIDKSRNIAIEELDRAILELKLMGLRINPAQHNTPINNRALCWPILRRLSELQKIRGEKLVVSVNGYGDHMFNTAERLMETAQEFPDLIFIMQHAGFVWSVTTLADTAAKMSNVFLDITTMPQNGIVTESYERYGIEKFCIGIDGPFGSKAIKDMAIQDLCKDDNEKALLLGGNLSKALGIDDTWRKIK